MAAFAISWTVCCTISASSPLGFSGAATLWAAPAPCGAPSIGPIIWYCDMSNCRLSTPISCSISFASSSPRASPPSLKSLRAALAISSAVPLPPSRLRFARALIMMACPSPERSPASLKKPLAFSAAAMASCESPVIRCTCAFQYSAAAWMPGRPIRLAIATASVADFSALAGASAICFGASFAASDAPLASTSICTYPSMAMRFMNTWSVLNPSFWQIFDAASAAFTASLASLLERWKVACWCSAYISAFGFPISWQIFRISFAVCMAACMSPFALCISASCDSAVTLPLLDPDALAISDASWAAEIACSTSPLSPYACETSSSAICSWSLFSSRMKSSRALSAAWRPSSSSPLVIRMVAITTQATASWCWSSYCWKK
mmetsp:Transcript_10668/g.30200  ORF Transcript_10668/g.30200 Transcript_10668/m.30200 type:complete len:379 (-) Transcript_10668:1282-2418(-)